jgi:hypothetical protein
MSIIVSRRFAPAVAVAAMWGDTTLEDVDVMRHHYRAFHAQGHRFVTFVDARRANVPGSAVRRAVADMSNEFVEDSKKNSMGVIIVLDSKLLVGVLTAIRWFLRTDVTQQEWFASATACRPRIEELLTAEKLAFPEGLVPFLKKLDAAEEKDLPAFGDPPPR